MKILIYMGHPAHYHLFKNLINNLEGKHQFLILIKKKDILEDLIKESGLDYINIQPDGRGNSIFGIGYGLVKRDLKIYKYVKSFKPNLLLGTSVEITHVGKLTGKPAIVFSEDDYNIIPFFSFLGYPFAKTILSPMACNNGFWESKSIKYAGYHKLAYLHPNYFKPNLNIVEKVIDINKPYFILRFADLHAHHDFGKKGINNLVAKKLIKKLEKYGNVYITSERKLDNEFERYRLKVKKEFIHHILYFSKLYIGDSQSMAVEAAILGVPGIRFNDFIGKIGVLEELEHKYKLTIGIKTSQEELLFNKIDELLSIKDLNMQWREKRKLLLQDKIDVTSFFIWFIENYPKSLEKNYRQNEHFKKK